MRRCHFAAYALSTISACSFACTFVKPVAGEANELGELNPPDEGVPNAEVPVDTVDVPYVLPCSN